MGIDIPQSWNKMWVGALFGVLAPIVVFSAYLYSSYSYVSLHEDMFGVLLRNIFSPLMSLSTVINLGLFYLFLWKQRPYAANGVIFSTIVIAIIVFIYKFLVVGT